jgi:SAM-dependent methyltransferase
VSEAKEIVERGYDEIAARYANWRSGIEGSPDEAWLGGLLARLPERAAILELGCGQGGLAAQTLAAGHRYSGVDISAAQLRHARELVPEAEFQQADVTEIRRDAESLHAVVSLYVFGHLPRVELPGLLQRIVSWLRPGGYLLSTFARSGTEGVQDDWLGVPMFFASYTEAETLELVRRAGLEIERDEIVAIVEPDEGEARFLWVLARKLPAGPGWGQVLQCNKRTRPKGSE